jgi:hypothetical protein
MGKLEGIQGFIAELGQFAQTAEETLSKIESDMEGNKHLFSVFSERMLTIRGTAQQLELPNIASLAELGEEIAVKGAQAAARSQIRKCVGSLWDALTTIKHLLVHYDEETSEEQDILLNRLNATLRALGGAREKVSEGDIDALLKQRG